MKIIIQRQALVSHLLILIGLLTLQFYPVAHAHSGHTDMAKKSATQTKNCVDNEIACAKTVTSAFAPNGDLWRLWSINQALFFDISKDAGVHFSQPQRVGIPNEKVSARNENRPKIAFDDANGVYLSWASPLSKRYTANIRFAYSPDYGKTFSAPITVNNDGLLAGHSFNEMVVSPQGDVSIVWLDGRNAHALRQQGKKAQGSALYLGKANVRAIAKATDKAFSFSNEELADGTCQCCRIAIDENKHGNLAILWRHIFGDNIREFAMMTVENNKQSSQKAKPSLVQYTHDQWHIEGCPHHGGGLSIDENNTYHTVWFNLGSKGRGIFYARSNDLGVSHSTPLRIGDINAQAAHGNVISNKNVVDIVWTQFNGKKYSLWHKRSTDFGKTFSDGQLLHTVSGTSDRPFLVKHNNKNYVSWQLPQQGHWFKAL